MERYQYRLSSTYVFKAVSGRRWDAPHRMCRRRQLSHLFARGLPSRVSFARTIAEPVRMHHHGVISG